MASNFNIHHDVNELLKLLDVDESVITADTVTEKLLKSNEHKSKTREAAPTFYKKLEEQSDSQFKSKYDDLKVQNVIELDPLVHLLARISDDKQIKFMLHMQNKKAEHQQQKLAARARERENTPMERTSSSSSNIPFSVSTMTNVFSTPLNGNANETRQTIKDSDLQLTMDSVKFKVKELPKKKDTSKGNVSKLNDWKFLSLDYQTLDWSRENIKPLNEMSVPEQENALIQDLLYVLNGIEGQYIRLIKREDSTKLCLVIRDKSGDQLLYTQVSRIIDLCPYYSKIIFFIDENLIFDTGMVVQALAGAMKEQVKDYKMLIAQLETHFRKGDLTLQKMWYLLQPCFINLKLLKHFAASINLGKISGGAVLSVLHDKIVQLAGNTKEQEFCLKLTQRAAAPYFEILETWIYQGIIDDPYKEFFVEDRDPDNEKSKLNDDLYWETRYTVSRKQIPVFLERYFEKILKTGTYLSMIRNCGKKIQHSDYKPMVYTMEDRIYSEWIESTYKNASKELMRLMNESDLIGRLKSIKHYFLMDQADYIVQFMDLADDELEKDIDDIVPNRMDSLLELSLRTSMMNSDPYKDDVQIELLPDSLLAQMYKIINIGNDFTLSGDDLEEDRTLRGCEALALTFKVPWLLSLILTKRNITCYQMLFRHLFYCKYVERQLEEVWKVNKIAKRFTLNAVTGYAQAFALRQKMLNFVQNLQYYIMVEVVEPNFHHFLEDIHKKANSVDDMSKHHQDYIDKCLRDAMLTSGILLQVVYKLLHLCVSYSHFMKTSHRHADQYELLDTDELYPGNPPVIEDEDGEKSSLKMRFADYIVNMDEEFKQNLKLLLEEVAVQSCESYTSLPDFQHGLDFNKFYSRSFNQDPKRSETP